MNNPFLSFKHKNYRYYIFGMFLSNIGTWMQNVAQPWVAYQVTNDAFKISVIFALEFLPVLTLSLFAGAIIEKMNKKNALVITQMILFLATMIFAVLVFTNIIQYWHIVMLATIMGTVTAFDNPIRQSFIVQLVPKADLMNAIALNATGFNLARIVGPAIAGIIMGVYGAGFCFLLNSISFLAVIISSIFIKPILSEDAVMEKKRQTINTIICQTKDGLRYIYKRKQIFYILLSNFFVSCFAMNIYVILPVFVANNLHMQEFSFGFILTCMGIGSLLGALLMASRSKKGPNKFFITFGPLIISCVLILNGILINYYATLLLYAVFGYTFVSYSSTTNASIQIIVDDEYRSRAMSVYTLVFSGTLPIGSLLAGIIVSNFGAHSTFIINGSVITIFMLIFIIVTAKNNEEIHK